MSSPKSAYSIPTKKGKLDTHIFVVWVDNESGVLARVVGLFSGRGYNIESLAVAEVDAAKNISRITIVTTGTPQVVVANNNASGGGFGNYTLVYTATGSTANRKRFTLTSQSLGNTDVLTTGAAPIVLAGGSTISDTAVGGTTVAASLVLSGHTVAVTIAS